MLKAGTAVATITPERPSYLQGYGKRMGRATGTLDSLEARVIALDDATTAAAIVSVDLLGLDAAFVARIRDAAAEASPIPPGNVMVVCSHTHAGPAIQTAGEVPIDREYLGWLERRLGDAVGEAAASMAPVTVGAGEGRADFNVNRRRRWPDGSVGGANPSGAVDHRVRVLRLDRADAPDAPGTLGDSVLPQSDPVAVLFSFACHSTVLMSANYRYSGDYPGAARRFIESAYAPSGTIAAFLPGCFGNARPHLLDPNGGFRGGSDHELKVLGRILGSEVVGVAERLECEPADDMAVASREVVLPYSHVPDEAELRAVADPDDLGWAAGLLDAMERDGGLPDHETGEVAVLRLGRHWIVTTPGETLIEIGWSIERGLAELGLADPGRGDMTLALGYANGNSGYLCTAAAMFEGGYEPARAYKYYLRPGPFAPEVEPTLIETALDLAMQSAH
jgi:neutral ceramidase